MLSLPAHEFIFFLDAECLNLYYSRKTCKIRRIACTVTSKFCFAYFFTKDISSTRQECWILRPRPHFSAYKVFISYKFKIIIAMILFSNIFVLSYQHTGMSLRLVVKDSYSVNPVSVSKLLLSQQLAQGFKIDIGVIITLEN